MPIRDDSPPPDDPLKECAVCHQQVPRSTLVRLGGREVCAACAAMWWDDDEDDEAEK